MWQLQYFNMVFRPFVRTINIYSSFEGVPDRSHHRYDVHFSSWQGDANICDI